MPELVYNSPVGPLIISIHNQKVVGIKWATVASPKKGSEKFQLDSFANENEMSFSGGFQKIGIWEGIHIGIGNDHEIGKSKLAKFCTSLGQIWIQNIPKATKSNLPGSQ